MERWEILPSELFKCFKRGLQPHTIEGFKVIDYNDLPRRTPDQLDVIKVMLQERLSTTIWGPNGPITHHLKPSTIEEQALDYQRQQKTWAADPPKGCVAWNFDFPCDSNDTAAWVEKIKAFMFKREDVEAFEQEQSLGPARTGETAQSNKPDSTGIAESGNWIRRDRQSWRVCFKGSRGTIGKDIGLNYIATLLEHPHEEYTATQLFDAYHHHELLEKPMIAKQELTSDSGVPSLDRTSEAVANSRIPNDNAWKPYRTRLRELAADREKAEELNDQGRIDEIDGETKEIENELSRIGRPNVSGRNTGAVHKAIDRSFGKIQNEKKLARLHNHLVKYYKRVGDVSSYVPDEQVDWKIEIK